MKLFESALLLVFGVTCMAQAPRTVAPIATFDCGSLLPTDFRARAQVHGLAAARGGLYVLFADGPKTDADARLVYLPQPGGAGRLFGLPTGQLMDLAADAAGHPLLQRYDRPTGEVSLLQLDPSSGAVKTLAARQSPGMPGTFIPLGSALLFLLATGGVEQVVATTGAAELEMSVGAPPAYRDVRVLPNGKFALVDKTSGEILIVDVGRRTAAKVAPRDRELAEAVSKNQENDQRLRQPNGCPKCVATSTLMTVYASAADEGGNLYLAISPYNRFAGAVVVEVGEDGRTRTLRCVLPSAKAANGRQAVAAPVALAAAAGKLFLVSGSGTVSTYQP